VLELELAEDARERRRTREVERHCGIARRIESILIDLGEPLKMTMAAAGGSPEA